MLERTSVFIHPFLIPPPSVFPNKATVDRLLTTGAAASNDVDLASCASFYFLAAKGTGVFSPHVYSGGDAPM